jgi:hypothetical protein
VKIDCIAGHVDVHYVEDIDPHSAIVSRNTHVFAVDRKAQRGCLVQNPRADRARRQLGGRRIAD